MITPYGDEERKTVQVQRMFNRIAPTYDRLNRIISLGLDRSWRQHGLTLLQPYTPISVLDIATGTGDLAIDIIRNIPSVLHVQGVDISEEMMRIGATKVRDLGLDTRITFSRENCAAMSFEDETFDAVTIGFGIRNFEDIPQAAREIFRVLRPGKPAMILELTEPSNLLTRLGYKLYSKGIIPWIGRLISDDDSAYTYLPRSIAETPQRQEMVELLRAAGFSEVYYRSLFPGTCAVYMAIK